MLVAACGDDEVVDPPVDNPPTIDLLTPNGGDAYASGEVVSITWTATDDGTFTVGLSYTAGDGGRKATRNEDHLVSQRADG